MKIKRDYLGGTETWDTATHEGRAAIENWATSSQGWDETFGLADFIFDITQGGATDKGYYPYDGGDDGLPERLTIVKAKGERHEKNPGMLIGPETLPGQIREPTIFSTLPPYGTFKGERVKPTGPAKDDTESDGQLLGRLGADGMKWAEEFTDRFAVLDRTTGLTIEQGSMIAWFANAIEAGRDNYNEDGPDRQYLWGRPDDEA